MTSPIRRVARLAGLAVALVLVGMGVRILLPVQRAHLAGAVDLVGAVVVARVHGFDHTGIARRGLALLSSEGPRLPEPNALLDCFADFVLSAIVGAQLAQR